MTELSASFERADIGMVSGSTRDLPAASFHLWGRTTIGTGTAVGGQPFIGEIRNRGHRRPSSVKAIGDAGWRRLAYAASPCPTDRRHAPLIADMHDARLHVRPTAEPRLRISAEMRCVIWLHANTASSSVAYDKDDCVLIGNICACLSGRVIKS